MKKQKNKQHQVKKARNPKNQRKRSANTTKSVEPVQLPKPSKEGAATLAKRRAALLYSSKQARQRKAQSLIPKLLPNILPTEYVISLVEAKNRSLGAILHSDGVCQVCGADTHLATYPKFEFSCILRKDVVSENTLYYETEASTDLRTTLKRLMSDDDFITLRYDSPLADKLAMCYREPLDLAMSYLMVAKTDRVYAGDEMVNTLPLPILEMMALKYVNIVEDFLIPVIRLVGVHSVCAKCFDAMESSEGIEFKGSDSFRPQNPVDYEGVPDAIESVEEYMTVATRLSHMYSHYEKVNGVDYMELEDWVKVFMTRLYLGRLLTTSTNELLFDSEPGKSSRYLINLR
jgi:hypothetical protein